MTSVTSQFNGRVLSSFQCGQAFSFDSFDSFIDFGRKAHKTWLQSKTKTYGSWVE